MINLIFFFFLLEFPPGCSCLQVAAGADVELFAAVDKIGLVGVDTDGNDGIYDVVYAQKYPATGILFVRVDPPPLVFDLHFHRYGVTFDPHKVFDDGFESGDVSGWSAVVGEVE